MNSSFKLGTWMSAGSPAIVELAAECGLDWILLDLEHGEYGEDRLLELLRCLRGTDTLGIVRVPAAQPDLIGRVLDQGADGIMVPHMRSAAEAAVVVTAMRYPPAGRRGVSRTVRAHGYGTRALTDRPAPVFLAQIECLDGVVEAEAIAAVNGVDALFIGPADLKHCLAHTEGEPDFETCLERVLEAVSRTGKDSGILVRDDSDFQQSCEQGIRWIARGSDLGILRKTYQDMRSENRQ